MRDALIPDPEAHIELAAFRARFGRGAHSRAGLSVRHITRPDGTRVRVIPGYRWRREGEEAAAVEPRSGRDLMRAFLNSDRVLRDPYQTYTSKPWWIPIPEFCEAFNAWAGKRWSVDMVRSVLGQMRTLKIEGDSLRDYRLV